MTQGDGSQDQNDVVNFGVNYAYINSSSFSCPTKIGGNLSVSQGNGTSDQVYFGENFGNVDGGPALTREATIGGNVKIVQGSGNTDDVAVAGGYGWGQYVRDPGKRLTGPGRALVKAVATMAVLSFSWPTKIGGNLSVIQGDGAGGPVNFSVNFGSFSDSYFSDPTTVGGNLSVAQGNGAQDEVNFGVNFGYVYASTFTEGTKV